MQKIHKKHLHVWAAWFGAVVFTLALVGCDAGETKLSKEEEAQFKGGPMPESARKIMQEKMKEAQAKGSANGQPVPPADAVPR
jgi:hypothetical protein